MSRPTAAQRIWQTACRDQYANAFRTGSFTCGEFANGIACRLRSKPGTPRRYGVGTACLRVVVLQVRGSCAYVPAVTIRTRRVFIRRAHRYCKGPVAEVHQVVGNFIREAVVWCGGR